MNINGEYLCHLTTAAAAGGVGIHSLLDFIILKTSLLAIASNGGEAFGVCFECFMEKTCSFVFIRDFFKEGNNHANSERSKHR